MEPDQSGSSPPRPLGVKPGRPSSYADQPPRFGGAGRGAQKYSQIRLSRPEAVTAANATRNAVIRSLSIVPENVARILGSYIATARETPPDLTRSRDAPRK